MHLQVPAGILYLRVLEARNLPNMDIFTKTDAYAVVFVRGPPQAQDARRQQQPQPQVRPACQGVSCAHCCQAQLSRAWQPSHICTGRDDVDLASVLCPLFLWRSMLVPA